MSDDRRKPPSVRSIWKALREELKENLYSLPTIRLAPAVHFVYLHPDDFDELEHLAARSAEELAKELTHDITRLNKEMEARRTSRFRNFLHDEEDSLPIEMPVSWHISVQEDQNGEIDQGAFGIESKLVMPTRPDFAGAQTIVTKSVFNNGRRMSKVSTSQATTGSAPAPEPMPSIESAAAPQVVFTFDDQAGHHEIPLRKQDIKIGRGTGSGPTDVTVNGTDKISREHCRISFEGGRFVVRDLSIWGTSVNGKSIPEALRSPEGAFLRAGTEFELPPRALISLADALVIHFRVGSEP